MKKKITRIMGVSLCAIMALTATACNNDSGNTNAATSNTTVAVSKDEYETEVTTLAATEKENNNTETTNGEIYAPSHKVDEIYNTTLEPNISDDILFDVNVKYYENDNYVDWRTQYEDDMTTYTFNFNDNPTYYNIINNISYELTPKEVDGENAKKAITLNVDNDILKFKYNGINHICKDDGYYNAFPRLQFELAENGEVLNDTEINRITDSTYIKAVIARAGAKEYEYEKYPCLFSICIKNKNGENYDIMAGMNYNYVKRQLLSIASVDEEVISTGRDEHNQEFITLKNNNNTLIIVKFSDVETITTLILINNNI